MSKKFTWGRNSLSDAVAKTFLVAAEAPETAIADQTVKNIIFIDLFCLEKFKHKEHESA